MDKIGEKCVEKGKHLYYYKGRVSVMPLAMVDDILGIAKCEEHSVDLNTTINSRIEMKKLKFHTPDSNGKSKCHTIHIGKNATKWPMLKVHGHQMEKVSSDTYLGDVISSDGKNKLNVETRVAKGLGIVNQIMDILKCTSFGAHFFEIVATLRDSILINGILTNCEVWYGLTDTEVNQLEEVDRLLLRQVFNVASSCPTEALYLELGCVPVGLIIKSRRTNYLHHLATRNENEMLYQFFMTQWNYPCRRNEWTEQVKADLKELGIGDDLSWIMKKSKMSFKSLVKKQVRELALFKLSQKKQGHSKMSNLNYTNLEIQEYLKKKDITPTQAKIVFKFRTRMEKFSENFKGGKPTKQCPICTETEDTQEHSFKCKVINMNIQVEGNLSDIFTLDIDKKTAKTLESIVKFRESYLEN